MTDTSAQEPTMEEILASIRRIISEDDAPVAAPEAPTPPPAAVAAAPEPEPAPAPPAPPPVVEPEPEDVLELTEPVAPPKPAPVRAPPPPPVLDDIDFAEPPPVARAPAFASFEPEEGLLSDRVAQTAAGHFGSLAHSVLMPAEGRTLEDVVKELLRPLLKEWLDAHLAGIVEAKVQSEVERISRRRV